MNKLDSSRSAIFSIKPKFISLIFSGLKTVELRRTKPLRIRKGTRIFFWETSPSKQLAGFAHVEAIISAPVEKLWTIVSEHAGVTREEFDAYFEGSDLGVAVFLSDATEFRKKPQLSVLRKHLGFMPPQSFRYVSASESRYIGRRASSAA
ncbi:MAG: ASCH domain-containing protein [candidate division Zixibacteria bacterium]|nr:ASCH domain-containing protein [candidate division Zixibacteria bacterium]MDH3939108.1 ASCH domain-containing protein [candidate division Zixibacteria bacterium]MDH4032999.1 ASCH domain-containing protein [candidate division Zixibacteria bacterium]